MRRAHAMPFGAEHRGAETRFSLWAPGVHEVALELGRGKPRRLEMRREREGWHQLTVKDVAPGEAYAFRVKPDLVVPDPASRFNPWDVNGPSAVVHPHAYEWRDARWRGRPWREAVVYELHVGTFTAQGTYLAAIEKLDHLAGLGVTAVELLPLADFAGRRNWGYDGVLPFAPDAAYGSPEELKRFVDEAHARGLMVLIDVVYNHFGPAGNYLNAYAPQFFNEAHKTPWGAAINFDGEHARTVRDFFVHNALYWLEEFHFDGLRMDAVHAIPDDSPRHIVLEIAEAIAKGPGRERHIHQVLENELHQASLLDRTRLHATAQWADDFHHGVHVLAAGERDGYYADYADRPLWHIGRALAEGFSYQGDFDSPHSGKRRGEKSAHLPPESFVLCLQNHDQVGNRALGERLEMLARPEALRLAAAMLCLAPSIPMIFMGEEFGARTPFLFFCDFEGDLAKAVREGRRKEFAAFERFRDPEAREKIPDPLAEHTFLASKLQWDDLRKAPHARWLDHYRALLAARARHIVPRLGERPAAGRFRIEGACGLECSWKLADGSRLHMRVAFGDEEAALTRGPGELLHLEGEPPRAESLAPWSGAWTLEAA
jgi:maltooligosyltrehalose trehalohydrolase